jgi:hypothetical protein
VTNNTGFRIGWLDLLTSFTITLNHNQFTITHNTSAQFWSDLSLFWSELWLTVTELVQSQSYFTTGGLSPISSSWRQASWESRPVFFFPIEHLRLESLCNILSEERMGLLFTIAAGPRQAWVPWDSWHYTVSDLRRLQPWGSSPRIYIPQEQGGSVIPPGSGFTFRRLLRLAGLRWRYSNHEWLGFYLNGRLNSVAASMDMLADPTATSWFRRIYIFHFRIPGNVFLNSFPRNGSTCHNTLTKFVPNSVHSTWCIRLRFRF